MKKANVYVRDFKTRDIVKEIEVTVPMSERQRGRLVSGLLRNMNTDRFYVDDSELDPHLGLPGPGPDDMPAGGA